MRKKWGMHCIAALFAAACLAGCAKPEAEKKEPAGEEAAGTETDAGENSIADAGETAAADGMEDDRSVVIWLDAENESYVRRTIGGDAFNGAATSWRLVDKSHLSGEEYRREFWDAMESGNAPDIIYMDTKNGLNPRELMESGALCDITGTKIGVKKPAYVEGAQEAGTLDGKWQVVPLFMETPVVFGLEEDLREAGIETEGMYGSLAEFLEALLAAREKTGKLIFENADAVEWLEIYYMPEDDAEAERVQGLLDQVREGCGTETATHGAYRMLEAGECLLGGCGVWDFKRMCANIPLFDRTRTPVALGVPDAEGQLGGVITHAVAVNAASGRLEEAKEALQTLMASYTESPDVDAGVASNSDVIMLEYWGRLVSESPLTVNAAKAAAGGFLDARSLESLLADIYVKETHVTSFAQEYGMRPEEGGHAHDAQTETLGVHYPDWLEGADNPFAAWLSGAADAYEGGHEGVHVQLTPVQIEKSSYHTFAQMELFGKVAPDIGIHGVRHLQSGRFGIPKSAIRSADFSEEFEENRARLGFLPDFLKDGAAYENVDGLPIGAEEYGIWVDTETLTRAGLPESWRPQDAGELTEGLLRLQGLSPDGSPYTLIDAQGKETDAAKALALFAENADALLKRGADGSYTMSKEAWTDYLSLLAGWRDDGLVGLAYSETGSETDTVQKFADGSIGAYIGSSRFSVWLDGDAPGLTKERREHIRFIRLSPLADVQMMFVPEYSEHAREAFDFWLAAVGQEDYESWIGKCGYVPVTELEDGLACWPDDAGKNLSGLAKKVWNSDKAAEELAEECQWFDYAEGE